MKTEESVKAEDIDGYRGGEDLDSLLEFIESKPKGQTSHQSESASVFNQSAASAKAKRSRRIDRKTKRSRTPSVNTSCQEKSPDASQSQKTSRASSATSRSATVPPTTIEDNPSLPDPVGPDSVTTVKNCLIVVNNTPPSTNNQNNAKKPVKKPKKQAGWLVDFNNDLGKSSRVKAKPPSGKSNSSASVSGGGQQNVEILSTKKEEITSSTTTTQEIRNAATNEDSSDETHSVQDEIMLIPEDEEESNVESTIESNQISAVESTVESTKPISFAPTTIKTIDKAQVVKESQKNDVCFNYASILKFIKQGKNNTSSIFPVISFKNNICYTQKNNFTVSFQNFKLKDLGAFVGVSKNAHL